MFIILVKHCSYTLYLVHYIQIFQLTHRYCFNEMQKTFTMDPITLLRDFNSYIIRKVQIQLIVLPIKFIFNLIFFCFNIYSKTNCVFLADKVSAMSFSSSRDSTKLYYGTLKGGGLWFQILEHTIISKIQIFSLFNTFPQKCI